MSSPDARGARRLLDVAKLADPDPWRCRLRDALVLMTADERRALADLRQLAESADTDNLPAPSWSSLASALLLLRDKQTAISLFRRAQRIYPGDFWINWHLGHELKCTGHPDEAIRLLSVAVAIQPRSGLARRWLGKALQETGRLEDAVATLRLAVRHRPQDAECRVGLGTVLLDLGEDEQARARFREAKRQKADNMWIRNEIAGAYRRQGDWKTAIAELRAAATSEAKSAFASDMLGLTLFDIGRVDEAIVSFREAVRLDPQLIPAHFNLARALLAAGDFEAALESARRGDHGTIGRFPAFAADLIRTIERMMTLESRRPERLRGLEKAVDATETADFARQCRIRHQYAASARLWGEAFAAQPALADDIKAGNRYSAATSAALAGCGRGRDEPAASPDARNRLRKQALLWLEADLAILTSALESAPFPTRDEIPSRLGRWLVDPALAGLRTKANLNALPDDERYALRDFWSRVRSLRLKARNRAAVASFASPS